MSASLTKYEISEAIGEFSKLVNRVQQGEEILLTKDGDPVARLIGYTEAHERRDKILRDLFTDEEIEELSKLGDTPLSPDNQRILEGEGTDEVGIWVGLREADQRVPEPRIPDYFGAVPSRSDSTGNDSPGSKFLLDSHALLWWASESPNLSARASAAISGKDHEVMVSVVSLYELLFKANLGKLATPVPKLQALLDSCTLRRLPLTELHAQIAAKIVWLHKDPWDRLLAAQAITERAHLVSKDSVFDQLGITRIW